MLWRKILSGYLEAEQLSLTENLVFCKGWFSHFTYTMIKKLISVVTEETRLYLFHAYKLSSFNFLLLVIEKRR